MAAKENCTAGILLRQVADATKPLWRRRGYGEQARPAVAHNIMPPNMAPHKIVITALIYSTLFRLSRCASAEMWSGSMRPVRLISVVIDWPLWTSSAVTCTRPLVS